MESQPKGSALRSKLTRRELLKRSALGAAGLSAGSTLLDRLVLPVAAASPLRDQLVAGTQSAPVNMDPRQAEAYPSQQVYLNIFDSLLQDRDYNIKPALAAEWKQLDARTVEFRLRDDVAFHNGDPMTAEDVKFSFESLLDPKAHFGLASFLEPVKSVRVTGKYKVVVETAFPFGPLLHNIAQFSTVVNKRAITTSDPRRNPVGTGPYSFVDWVRDDHINLKANPKYWDLERGPHFERVRFRSILEDQVRVTALKTRAVDWMDGVPPNQLDALSKDASMKIVRGTPSVPQYLWPYGGKGSVFNNKKLRQALAWAIDRKAMAKAVWFGRYPVTYELYTPDVKWYTGVAAEYYKDAPDIDRAKRLVKEAGYPDGVTVRLICYEAYKTMAEVVQQQVAPTGIKIRIDVLNIGQFLSILFSKKDFDLIADLWFAYMDPDNHYYTFFKSDSTRNFTLYANAQMDQLLEKGRRALTFEARKAAYEDVVRLLVEEAPIVYCANAPDTFAMRRDLDGSQPWADRSTWVVDWKIG